MWNRLRYGTCMLVVTRVELLIAVSLAGLLTLIALLACLLTVTGSKEWSCLLSSEVVNQG